MIRINLLGGMRREEDEKPGAGPSSAFQAKVFVGSLVAVSVMVGAAYGFLSHRLAGLTAQMEIERREAARLAVIQLENTRYQAQLADINRRIQAIQTLEDNRQGPTQLMTALASMVNRAAGLYLISISPKENRLFLTGASGSVTSIADFVTALKTVKSFTGVELQEYYEDDTADGRVSFKFGLDCVYQPGETTAPQAPGPGHVPAALPLAPGQRGVPPPAVRGI